MPRRPVGAALFLLLLAAPAAAEPARKGEPGASFALSYDNDTVAGTDRYYTSGLQLDWRSASADPPRWLAWLNRQPGLILPEGGAPRWGLSLGQSIFTPADTRRRDPDPKDRPYAGWLYGSVSLVSSTASAFGAMELQLGVVGPSALGQGAQNGVHRLRGLRLAQGWSHQLKDEPGVNLILIRQWRWNTAPGLGGLSAGLVPSVTASLGNVMTYASAGLVLRLGSRLDADFGPPRSRPALSGSAFFDRAEGFGWYVFAGVEGRLVARNIFLDGNSWLDGPRVDRIPSVGDASLGAVAIWSAARLSATYTLRSREFTGQPSAAQYGSISLSFLF